MGEKNETLEDLRKERKALEEKQQASAITGLPQHIDVGGQKFVIEHSGGSGSTIKPVKPESTTTK